MGKATRAALLAMHQEQVAKKAAQKKFDDEYYVDVATGEVKKRLYTGRPEKKYPYKREEEE